MATLSFPVADHPSPTGTAEREAILANPGFGKQFSDHMVRALWTVGDGWHDGEVVPFGPIQLSPAAAVLHYAQEVFEGLKAYRHEDGSIWAFRPEANAARMARSCARLALPELPEADFIASIKALVQADEAWVPAFGTGETSLYLRPFMFASEAFLGVRPANEVYYSVIASPAGAYFAGGMKPVSLWVSTDFARTERAARARPSAAATTPPAWPGSSKASRTAVTRRSSSTPRRTRTSRNSAA